MKRLRFSLALLILFPSFLFAQQATCRRIVPVSVLDRDGLPVAGLTVENFRGEFRGAPVKIVSVKSDASPRRMVILLDLSSSMGTGKNFRIAQFIVAHALASTPAGGQVALITFADEVKVIGGLTQEKQGLAELIQRVNQFDGNSPRGHTALWDGMNAAADLLSPPQLGDIIYVVSDNGGDNASHIHRSQVEEVLLRSGHRLFALFVRADHFSRNRLQARSDLQDMAYSTGGDALNGQPRWSLGPLAESKWQRYEQMTIPDAARLSYNQMRQAYLIEFELPAPVVKPSSWKLELVADGKQPVKGLSLRYPVKLFPCSNSKPAQPQAPD